MKENETLEQFLDRIVRPDTEFLRNCSEVIDKIVRMIHKYEEYSVDHVIKGGSLGKGTAIRHHSDVDLLVVLNKYQQIEDLVEDMSDVLNDFEQYLSANQEVNTRNFCSTPFTVQFEVYCEPYKRWISVDLLPIVDIFKAMPFSGQRERFAKIYSTMKEKSHLRKYYAKCFARFQVEFVKEVPSRVKDLIRLMKYWKYSEDVRILSSYCIELLVIYVWENNDRPNNFTMKTLMKDVVQLLADFKSVAISFDKYYDHYEYYDALTRQSPYVLDPANPFHNVCPKEGWSDLNLKTFYGQSSDEVFAHGYSSNQQSYSASNNLDEVVQKGRLLMRKYNKLPEEKEECNTDKFLMKKYDELPDEKEESSTDLLKVTAGILTVGLGLGAGAYFLSKYVARDKDNKNK